MDKRIEAIVELQQGAGMKSQHNFNWQIEDAIQFACARAWITDNTREVSVESSGFINVLPPQHTPYGAFVIGHAYYRPEVKQNDGVWEGV